MLIVDIHKGCQSVALALQDAGFRVIEASESSEGVRCALDYSPTIIILSEDMPPISGVELLVSLRSLTESPIIVLGSDGEMASVQALLRGADVYLTRGVSIKEFMARIRSLLRRCVVPRGASGEPLLQC